MVRSREGGGPTIVVGVSGSSRNAAVAVWVDGDVLAASEIERITRVRRAGLNGSLADALPAIVQMAGNVRLDEVSLYASSEDRITLPAGLPRVDIEHHRAHAATAFHLSSFESAATLVCDSSAPDHLSMWTGNADGLVRYSWPAFAPGFASLYSECAELFGLARRQEHELEALARLDCGDAADRFAEVFTYRDGVLHAARDWKDAVTAWLGSGPPGIRHRAHVGAAFQRHLSSLLLAICADLQARTGQRHLCLGGGLFYNTSFTTAIRQSGIFDDVFVAPNPGNAGTAIGAAILAGGDAGPRRRPLSPFLGPRYDVEEIKRTLDNCKLSYECLSEREVVQTTVEALARGQLVGWFQGRMEWGHRALGNRSILASPLSPYVLDNLNHFLKHREPYRCYGLSVREEDAASCFDGPPASRYMEYEYRPTRPELRHALPRGAETLRVQTVAAEASDACSDRYRQLHTEFGRATGVPVLVNTSFNGFSEPIVCNPRDAIRVFFGTGLDMLVLDRFVLRK
jgi:carbamoyltransferase